MEILESLVRAYETPDEAIRAVRQTKIVLLVGIAGAGKDTIKHRLLARPEYHDIISHTTRAPRSNNGVSEEDGVAYHFITDEEARDMITKRQFIEVKYVHGTIYGTSIASLEAAQDLSAVAITDLDVQGVDEYKSISRDVVAIFIVPPSYEVWRDRLRGRYADEASFRAEWPKRRESAIRELSRALSLPYYHFIVNDSLDAAVEAADSIGRKDDTFHRKDDEVRLQARDLLEEITAQQD